MICLNNHGIGTDERGKNAVAYMSDICGDTKLFRSARIRIFDCVSNSGSAVMRIRELVYHSISELH